MKLSSILFLTIPTMSLIGCSGSHFINVSPNVSTNNLHATVDFLSTIDPPRVYYNKDSLEKCVEYISKKFIEYGYKPDFQKFNVPANSSTLSDETYKNIIASAGPTNGERIIIGAHYDVCGEQPGADDNASGIAGLLEIARFAKSHEKKLPLRVDFVAFCLEEPPFFGTTNMGSYAHAEMMNKMKIKVRAMICLDMIGFFRDEKNTQDYPVELMKIFYPSKGNFISVVGNFSSRSLVNSLETCFEKTKLNVETYSGPTFIPGIDFSDHRNYWHFDYKAAMISDSAFYRNPNYHKTTDTIDTLDFNRMKKVVEAVCYKIVGN